MIENWWTEAYWVYLAAGVQTIGFLIRNQLWLRTMILIGTILYIVYYYVEPPLPLWDAIACAVLMGLANTYTMARLMLDRRPARFSEDDLVIYRAIPQISPGEFRRLLAIAERAIVSESTEVTREGATPDYLYYLVDGTFTLDKHGKQRQIEAPTFVGEIAYMLHQPASATVTLDPGTRYIRWKVTDLRTLMARQTLLQNALEVAFNRDLAAKVVGSV